MRSMSLCKASMSSRKERSECSAIIGKSVFTVVLTSPTRGHVDHRTTAKLAGGIVDLDDSGIGGKEAMKREIGSQHQQEVAFVKRTQGRAPAQHSDHADPVRIVGFKDVHATIGPCDGCIDFPGEGKYFFASFATSGSAVYDDFSGLVDPFCQCVEIVFYGQGNGAGNGQWGEGASACLSFRVPRHRGG